MVSGQAGCTSVVAAGEQVVNDVVSGGAQAIVLVFVGYPGACADEGGGFARKFDGNKHVLEVDGRSHGNAVLTQNVG